MIVGKRLAHHDPYNRYTFVAVALNNACLSVVLACAARCLNAFQRTA